jgi:hypothetical protein
MKSETRKIKATVRLKNCLIVNLSSFLNVWHLEAIRLRNFWCFDVNFIRQGARHAGSRGNVESHTELLSGLGSEVSANVKVSIFTLKRSYDYCVDPYILYRSGYGRRGRTYSLIGPGGGGKLLNLARLNRKSWSNLTNFKSEGLSIISSSHTLKVPSSKFGLEIILTWDFDFPQTFQANSRIIQHIRKRRLHTFKFIRSFDAVC